MLAPNQAVMPVIVAEVLIGLPRLIGLCQVILLGLVLRYPAGVVSQVRLAWLATSIATLGGALGAALESGESVREAAYTYQPDTQIDAVADPL